jgi:hypothetical protein
MMNQSRQDAGLLYLLRHSCFGIRHSFVIECFVIRHLSHRQQIVDAQPISDYAFSDLALAKNGLSAMTNDELPNDERMTKPE